MSWRFLGGAVAGSSHRASQTPCQDSFRCGTLPGGFWAAVADGAGSASCSRVGSDVACRRFARCVAHWVKRRQRPPLTEQMVGGWARLAKGSVERLAARYGRTPRDYACTFLAIVVTRDMAFACQVGDGVIVTQNGDAAPEWVFWPDHGEYINTTCFLTGEDALARLRVRRLPAPPTALALLTDGLEPLVLHYASRTAHAPFFTPLWERLAVEPAGEAATLQLSLLAFLESEAINARTDDDKTLVLAVRKADAVRLSRVKPLRRAHMQGRIWLPRSSKRRQHKHKLSR